MYCDIFLLYFVMLRNDFTHHLLWYECSLSIPLLTHKCCDLFCHVSMATPVFYPPENYWNLSFSDVSFLFSFHCISPFYFFTIILIGSRRAKRINTNAQFVIFTLKSSLSIFKNQKCPYLFLAWFKIPLLTMMASIAVFWDLPLESR